MKKIAVLLYLLLVITFLAQSQETEIISARFSALGGLHAALTDDVSTIFNNPAGFQNEKPIFQVAELSLGLAGPIFDISSVILAGASGGDMSDLMSDANVSSLFSNMYAGLDLVGPISIAYVGNGLGLGFFNWIDMEYTSWGTIPMISTVIRENILLGGGYTYRIPLPEEANSTLDIGAFGKVFINNEVSFCKSTIEFFGLVLSPDSQLLLSEPYAFGWGLGLDLGIRYNLADIFTVGLVGRNTIGWAFRYQYSDFQEMLHQEEPEYENYMLPQDLSVGIMVTPPLAYLQYYISELKILLDYNDILDFVTHEATAKTPLLHLGLGLEMTLLEILFFRAGYFQGYFTTGVGIDLSFMNIAISMFGTERSTEPGMNPVYNLILSLQFMI